MNAARKKMLVELQNTVNLYWTKAYLWYTKRPPGSILALGITGRTFMQQL